MLDAIEYMHPIKPREGKTESERARMWWRWALEKIKANKQIEKYRDMKSAMGGIAQLGGGVIEEQSDSESDSDSHGL